MNSDKQKAKQIQKAKNQVRKIKIFYFHLALYLVVVALILFNFYIIEEGPYKNNVTALNVSVLVLWTFAIFIHGWRIFKGRFIFKKSWEDRKIEQILNKEEETTFWE
ncbi:2TM domain-containing protein [Psychroserpens sp. Hel_I_66]|uniref:2TM domain-containing protein n=1 Tax=Psychroserpens sp. Hel_I_66 TaxID=1250004 RepID=UPI000647F0B8|nr:2TM domain-containing protein [Psychroserpens sp. Hel_I_66]